MHTIETSIIMAIVIYFYATLISHVFKWEVNISKNLNEKTNRIKISYMKSGSKEYLPDNIARVVNCVDEYLEKQNKD